MERRVKLRVDWVGQAVKEWLVPVGSVGNVGVGQSRQVKLGAVGEWQSKEGGEL